MIETRSMTAAKDMEIAAYQRPGVRLIVGAIDAREERMAPMSRHDLHNLPGFRSWMDRDLGYKPSLWQSAFMDALSLATEAEPTLDDWREFRALETGEQSFGTREAWEWIANKVEQKKKAGN